MHLVLRGEMPKTIDLSMKKNSNFHTKSRFPNEKSVFPLKTFISPK